MTRRATKLPNVKSTPLLVFGPTASGKSDYAMARAKECPSLIINADSMQVYRDLHILTARPPEPDEAEVPHALYGHADGAEAYSTGRYTRDLENVLLRAAGLGHRPIIVGGTGLYFRAILQGLSPVPAIPDDVRTRWREMQREAGTEEVWRVLHERDPSMAARLQPTDPQRIVRALEVLEATGRSLSAWQEVPGRPLLREASCERVLILPPRPLNLERAEARFDAMVDNGALDEVARLRAQRLDPALPIMRALGVPPLLRHLNGEIGLSEAVAEAKHDTRAYIKRQSTWARRQMTDWTTIHPDLEIK